MNKNTEERIEGDWPKVRVRYDHNDNRIKRKVVETRVKRIPAGDLVKRIVRELRTGASVELLDENGDGAIRICAVVGPKLDKMYASCIAMKPLSHSLNDIGFSIVRGRGRDEHIESAEKWAEEAKQMAVAAKDETPSVTPDSMVTCPKCGTRFRIGRRLAN